MMKLVAIMAVAMLGLIGCGLTSGGGRYGQTVVRDTAAGPAQAVQVLPSKQYWRKSGASRDDMVAVRKECTAQLRSGGEYMDLLNEQKPLTLAIYHRTASRSEKDRDREIDRRLSQLYTDCMASKGYEYVPRGFPVE